MDILLLSTPNQHQAKNPAVETNPRRLKIWLSKLPVDDVILTVKQLISAIEAFNELYLYDSERLKLLEIYTQAFETILHNYDQLRIKQLKISISQQRVLAEDVMWLYLGLAGGYKEIVNNGHEHNLSAKRDNVYFQAMYRAMELIIRALTYAYQAHISPPPLTYLEINQLYQLAEFQEVQDYPNKNIQGRSTPATISNLYKQINLLTVADAYRYDTHQIAELFMYIESFSALCEIYTRCNQNQDYIYKTDLMDDQQPNIYAFDSSNDDTSHWRYFDFKPCVTGINEWLTNKPSDKQAILYEQERELLTTFVQQLEHQWHKQANKTGKLDSAFVAIGFGPIVETLKLTNSPQANQISSNAHTLVTENRLHQFGSSGWQVIETSKYGDTLWCEHIDSVGSGLIEGNIVAMIGTGQNNISDQIIIGLIRWLRKFDNHEVKCGINILAHNSFAINWAQGSNRNADQLTHQGLYLPKDEALTKPATLLLNKATLGQSEILTVQVRGKVFTVTLRNSMMETQSLIQPRFKVLTK